jgi:hypothetical protein
MMQMFSAYRFITFIQPNIQFNPHRFLELLGFYFACSVKRYIDLLCNGHQDTKLTTPRGTFEKKNPTPRSLNDMIAATPLKRNKAMYDMIIVCAAATL